MATTEDPSFTLTHRIGSGTFGKVYKARASHDPDWEVAVKVMNKWEGHEEEPISANWISEITYLQLLCPHPNIIEYIGQGLGGDGDDLDFFVVELMDCDLRSFLDFPHQTCDVVTYISITTQVLSGLEHCHSRRVIHGDLKPDNILMKGGQVKLADFGSASTFDPRTPPSHIRGALAYSPPEVLDFGSGSCYDTSYDVWSAGVIFLEMIVGHNPLCHGCFSTELQRGHILRLFGSMTLQELTEGFNGYLTGITGSFLSNYHPDNLLSLLPEKHREDATLIDFINKMLEVIPKKRTTARRMLRHPLVVEAK